MGINIIATIIGMGILIEPIVIFIFFWRLMGITHAILRFFSTGLVSVMVYFLLFLFLFYIKSVLLDSIIFMAVFGIASYIMYSSYKDNKEQQQNPSSKFEEQKI